MSTFLPLLINSGDMWLLMRSLVIVRRKLLLKATCCGRTIKVCYKNIEVKELELDSSHICQEIEIEPRTTKILLNRYPWTIYMS